MPPFTQCTGHVRDRLEFAVAFNDKGEITLLLSARRQLHGLRLIAIKKMALTGHVDTMVPHFGFSPTAVVLVVRPEAAESIVNGPMP